MVKKFLVITAAIAAFAQETARPTVYTAAQAAAGRTAYESSCINCHTGSLIPKTGAVYMGQEIPPLAGAAFLSRWGDRAAGDLAIRIKTAIGGFPPKDLNEKTYLDLAAYVLQVNGALPGEKEISSATAVPVKTTIGAK
jgi:cytochrome c5